LRVLGLDPGFERLGFGVVAEEPLELPTMGVISYEIDPLLTFNQNLNAAISNICDSFPRIIQVYTPNEVAAEIVPSGKLGSKSELVVASITVCKVICYQWGIPWTDYGANTIKDTLTGDGLATKAQVRNAILDLYPEWQTKFKEAKQAERRQGVKRPVGIPQDAFDGAAAATTHVYKRRNGQSESSS